MNQNLEEKTIQTYNRVASQWANEHAAVNDWQDIIEEFHSQLPSGSVLEVGCGGGRDASSFLHLGYDYLGTDASAGMVKVAQETLPSASFIQCSVYNLNQLHRTFDGFWACAVLLHIPKQRIDEALQAISSVLRPGAIGMISIKDGNREEFEVRDKQGSHEERLFVYWKKQAFIEVLLGTGFSLLNYKYRPVSARTNWHIFIIKKKPV